MNKRLFFKSLSALIFAIAVFKLLTEGFIIGYCLLILGYFLLRKSDAEK
ncbi:hypothetical protein [Carnobacterium sp. TMP28]